MSAQVNPIPATAKKSAAGESVVRKAAILNGKRLPELADDDPIWNETEDDMIARVVDRAMKNAQKLGLEGKSRAEVTKMVQKSEDDYWTRKMEKILKRKSKMIGPEETRKFLKEHGLE